MTNKTEYEVIDRLLHLLLGIEEPVKVTQKNIHQLHHHLINSCPICGSYPGKAYLMKYGMCSACYGYMVCADGCVTHKPNKEKVLNDLYDIVIIKEV